MNYCSKTVVVSGLLPKLYLVFYTFIKPIFPLSPLSCCILLILILCASLLIFIWFSFKFREGTVERGSRKQINRGRDIELITIVGR